MGLKYSQLNSITIMFLRSLNSFALLSQHRRCAPKEAFQSPCDVDSKKAKCANNGT